MTPVQFMILSQAIIFILGWPLEWTEIIVIFVPIFLPLLKHFNIDPILWGVLVFVNLQAAFLSPPVAMSAFYLKGVSPQARHAQPDLRRHDALHADRHHLHGAHVHLAGDDAVAAELSLRKLERLIGFYCPWLASICWQALLIFARFCFRQARMIWSPSCICARQNR